MQGWVPSSTGGQEVLVEGMSPTEEGRRKAGQASSLLLGEEGKQVQRSEAGQCPGVWGAVRTPQD